MLWKNALLFVAIAACCATAREVAITIDDLPVGQSGPSGCEHAKLEKMTAKLLAPLQRDRVPVTAFVIAGNCEALTSAQFSEIVRSWQRAGAEIGNHTFTHPGLNSTSSEEYESDILRADRKLREITGKPLRYFRSPMLQTGSTPEGKERLERFLSQHGYQQAPVTFDNSDWMFAYVYAEALQRRDKALAQRIRKSYVPYLESVVSFFEERSVEVIGREFPQVMLLHANDLNASALPEILTMFRRRGYRFISLEDALKDSAYTTPNAYAGPGGFSWIHRWSMTKRMPGKGEPDEPAWLRESYEAYRK
jgi:peptidoglycan/xylan/chitin deacetylase (PgdA/CDA1 family)